MKFGLKDNIVEQINSVFKDFPQIEQVLIYGSRAKGNFKTGSDIDLTFIGKNLDHNLLNSISLKLDELYLPYFFDLSDFSKIKSFDLTKNIKRASRSFYTKNIPVKLPNN